MSDDTERSARGPISSRTSIASLCPSPGRGVTRPGIDSHRSRNSDTSGRFISANARPGRPPATTATLVASSAPRPRPSRADTNSARGTRPTCTVRHREATVAGKSSSDSATRRKTTAADGSSSVLRRALAAWSVMVPASGKRNTVLGPSTGRNAARATTDRICSTPRLVAPSGSITETSGWLPAATRRQDRQSVSWTP